MLWFQAYQQYMGLTDSNTILFQLKEVVNHMFNIFLIPVLIAVAGPPWCGGEAGDTGIWLSLLECCPNPFG